MIRTAAVGRPKRSTRSQPKTASAGQGVAERAFFGGAAASRRLLSSSGNLTSLVFRNVASNSFCSRSVTENSPSLAYAILPTHSDNGRLRYSPECPALQQFPQRSIRPKLSKSRLHDICPKGCSWHSVTVDPVPGLRHLNRTKHNSRLPRRAV